MAQMNAVESLGVLVGKKRKRQRQPQQLSHLMSGLLAAFQLQPSNTRVNEQAHGFARQRLRPGVSVARDDAMMTYHFDSYPMKQQVRELLRDVNARKKGTSTTPRSINICRTKDACRLQASLAMEKCDEYRSVPLTIMKDSLSVSQVSHRGINFLDKDLKMEENKSSHASKSKSRKKHRTSAEYKEEAANAILEIDLLYEDISLQEEKRRHVLVQLSTKGFWDSLQVKRDGFYDEVKNVLPSFWALLNINDEEKFPAKSAIMKSLRKFLDDAIDLSVSDESKVSCMNDKTLDLTHLDKWSRLEIYIMAEKCNKIKEKAELENNLMDIFGAFGSDINKAYCGIIPEIPIDDDDDELSSDDNEIIDNNLHEN